MPFMHLSANEIDVRWQYRYANQYPKAIRLVSAGLLNLKPLVTHRYPLEQGIEAFETANDITRGCMDKTRYAVYALGIGAKADELEYVYGAESDVNDFSKAVGSDRAPGLPKFDPNRAIHGGMSIETLRPLPVESGPGTLTKKIIGVTETNRDHRGCRVGFTRPQRHTLRSSCHALETSIWEVGPGPDGTTELAFVQKNLTSGKIALAQGLLVNYEFDVANGLIAPDGVTRNAILVNGRFPGPLISANKGDTIKVTVRNKLSDPTMRRSTTITLAWSFQHRTAEDDGPAFVTQCPIPPQESYTYNLSLDDQTGTYWYHSHLSSQYVDGLRGPLVIYVYPKDPYRNYYDEIMAAHDVLKTIPDSGTINGKGKYDPASANNNTVQLDNLYKLKVKRGKRIQGHKCTIIEADGILTKPIEVDAFDILAGQRYSCIVSLVPSLKLRPSRLVLDQCADTNVLNTNVQAMLEYDEDRRPSHYPWKPFLTWRITNEVIRYWQHKHGSHGHKGKGHHHKVRAIGAAALVANEAELDKRQNQDNSTVVLDETKLVVTLIQPGAPGGSRDADVVVPLVFGLNFGTGMWTINNISYSPPDVPTLLKILSDKGHVDASDLELQCGQRAHYILPKNKVVELHIKGQSLGIAHPIHLHGHAFDVVQFGNNPPNYGHVDASDFAANELTYILPKNKVVELHIKGQSLGIAHPIHLHGHAFDVVQFGNNPPNYVNPPRRDVVGARDEGVRIRFRTDNPGPWFLHCHIDWHMDEGFAMVFAEAPEDIKKGSQSVRPNGQWKKLYTETDTTFIIPSGFSSRSRSASDGPNTFLVSLSLFASAVLARTVEYKLTISNGTIAPDGFQRMATLVNGGYPGPLIFANKGDTSRSMSMYQTTSIHWHGLLQHRNADDDGPAFVTQCPIIPEASYTTLSLWKIKPEHTDPKDPHRHLYDVDDEKTVLIIGDWYHSSSKEILESRNITRQRPDSGTINGKGQAWKRYRLRIINSSAIASYRVDIPSHKMTVIAADGVSTQPYKVDRFDILAGQRIDVVLEANQEPDAYWINAPMTNVANKTAQALLVYEEDPRPPHPPKGPYHKWEVSEEIISANTTTPVIMDEAKLVPLENPGAACGSKPADLVLDLLLAWFNFTSGHWMINGIPYEFPNLPTLLKIPLTRTPSLNLIWNFGMGILHPIHLHGHTFDVVQFGNNTPNYINPPRRDTVGSLDSGVRIQFKTDNPGPVLAFHIDWHLEEGFAMVFAEAPEAIKQGPNSVPVDQQWRDLCRKYETLPPGFL
ncbi:Multicopper oxidase [Rhizoctonia solani]|uniref:Multicopper oxidase n=1 Tax=Rhizoctonia solani TaxID=456999 RepID=A0A8H8P2S3_9AGAM|nr:Multicopper oxidase [Rhizoctonia solani]QRW22763.1 Multicopper oxidase [Rhizoctonia solani]